MITWAVAWMFVKVAPEGNGNGVLLLFAMVFDAFIGIAWAANAAGWFSITVGG